MDKKTLKEYLELKQGLAENPALVIYQIIQQVRKVAMEAVDTELQKVQPEILEHIKRVQKGDKGDPGRPGRNGLNGKDGRDGYTPIKGVDYFDGKNADEGLIIRSVLSQLPEPKAGKDGEPGKDGSPDSPEQVIQKINSAPLGLKIRREHLELPEDTEGPRFGGGGGGGGESVTYSTEDGTISGAIDGVNTTYAFTTPLKNPVVFKNGIRQTKTRDYTVSPAAGPAASITFNTAIRAGQGPITVDGQPG